MKITDVETIMLRLPEVRRIGDGCQSVLIIRIHTDSGIIGIGEAHTNPLVSKAIIDAPLCSVSAEGLRSLLLGEDPRDISRLWDKMYRATQTYGRRGALMHALSGIDIALWDILGKVAGLPVHQLLGGRRRDAVTAYASDLSRDSVEETVEVARGHVAHGYKAMKFGWGGLGDNPRSDVKAVAAIRAAIGDEADLMIDMGFAVPLDHALYLARGCADAGVYFLEEPLSPDDLSGFERLVQLSPVAIATGEKESTQYPYLELMARGLRIIQPDVARVGGISEAMRIVTHAEARNVDVIPHCWSTDILVAATLQVLATQRRAPFLEYNATDNPLRTDLLVDPIRPDGNGRIAISDKPGLGIELNEDTIERYRWQADA